MAEIRLEGMDELIRNVQALGAKAARAENDALRAGGEVLAEAMRNNVRVSGKNEKHIRDDIQNSRVKTQGGVKYIETGPGKETGWRAKFLEFGHALVRKGKVIGHVPAYPFVGPAVQQAPRKMAEAMARVLKAALRL